MEISTFLFKEAGKANTVKALQIAKEVRPKFNAKKVIVASTTGKTALKALKIIGPGKLIVVSHAYGFYDENVDEMDTKVREKLKEMGIPVVTASHTLAGFARSVRREFKTYLTEDIVAAVLRTVCEGFKVSFELACMCADAGLVNTGERVICVAGTGEGADTVVMLRAANSHHFFKTHIEAILAKPM